MKVSIRNDKIKSFEFLLNNLKQKHSEYKIPSNCFFLGAGCSKSSNIPLGFEIIDLCRKLSYMNECICNIQRESEESFENYIKRIDEYINSKLADYQKFVSNKEKEYREQLNPEISSRYEKISKCYKKCISLKDFSDEIFKDCLYGNWFETFNQDKRERQKLIEYIIEDKNPDGAYIIFANLIKDNYIHNVFTTNFDDLLNDALLKYMDKKARVFSHNEVADYISFTSSKPNIVKLHGDFLFENIKNSNEETFNLNPNMKKKLEEALNNFGLFVVGYNGADNSIISILEEIKFRNKKDFLLIWCSNNPDHLHTRVINLINESNNSFFLKVQDFETLVGKLFAELKPSPPDLVKIAKETTENLSLFLTKFAESVKFKDVSSSEYKDIVKIIEAEKYFNEANSEKDKNKAINFFSKVIEINPYYSAAYNNRGILYDSQNRFKEALEDYNMGIQLNPYLAESYINRGIIYSKQNEFEKALEDFNKSIELNPNLHMAYINRATVLSKQKKFEDALNDLRKAIELNSNLVDVYNNRGVIYKNLKKYDSALAEFNEAIKLDPNDAYIYINRGNVYHNLNEYEKAESDFNKAIELNPNLAQAYNNRGSNFGMQNEDEKAIEDYTMAINLNHEEAYKNRGNIFIKQKEYSKALNDFLQIEKLNPNDISLKFNIVELYILILKFEIAEVRLLSIEKYELNLENKLIFYFFKCIVLKILGKTNLYYDNLFNKFIGKNINVSFSLNELEQFLKDNSNLGLGIRKYISEKIKLLKKQNQTKN